MKDQHFSTGWYDRSPGYPHRESLSIMEKGRVVNDNFGGIECGGKRRDGSGKYNWYAWPTGTRRKPAGCKRWLKGRYAIFGTKHEARRYVENLAYEVCVLGIMEGIMHDAEY